MKRCLLLLCALCLLLGGCSAGQQAELTQYNATFLTLFDTVTTIVGRAEDEATFKAQAQQIHDDLLVYHRLFDIYHDYEGVNNLKTLNDNAGVAPVTVDPEVIALLKDCRAYFDTTGGKVNTAMGSVLALWHEARNDGINDPVNAYLPDPAKLQAAAQHTGFDSIVIDEEACTVFITDPEARLDVGAVAKGWAVQRVGEKTPSGLLISVGGNVFATGPKAKDTPWVIGVQDPDQADRNLHTIYVNHGAVVTSGDYQRAYVVDQKVYHHIIDPETLMPAAYWRSVTIVCADSGLADALSTALFLLSLEEGKALAEACGADALWVDAAGAEFMTPGFEKNLRT